MNIHNPSLFMNRVCVCLSVSCVYVLLWPYKLALYDLEMSKFKCPVGHIQQYQYDILYYHLQSHCHLPNMGLHLNVYVIQYLKQKPVQCSVEVRNVNMKVWKTGKKKRWKSKACIQIGKCL